MTISTYSLRKTIIRSWEHRLCRSRRMYLEQPINASLVFHLHHFPAYLLPWLFILGSSTSPDTTNPHENRPDLLKSGFHDGNETHTIL